MDESAPVVTPLYGGKVQVKFHPKSHRYYVKDGSGEFEPVTGVTTYIGVKDKSRALGAWQQQMTVDFLLDLLAKGVKIDEERAVEACIQHELFREKAADIGKEIHAWAEASIKKELGLTKVVPEIPNFPEAVTGVNAFMDWRKKHKVKFLSTETVVYSRKYGYVGTEDVTFMADGILCDADFKSSNGLYNSVRMQTAAYAKAREEMGGKKCQGRWAIRLSKYTEEEYYRKEERKKVIKQHIALAQGKEVKDYPVKPYQVFEAAFLDHDKRALDADFKAFLNCMDLTKWDRKTDSFMNGGSLESARY